MISENALNKALTVVRISGVAQEIEAKLRTGRGGRPRQLSVELLFAACILAFGRGGSTATLVEVHAVLTERLPASLQLRLGIAHKIGTKLTLRQVRYLFEAISAHLDYSPHTGHHRDGSRLSEAERIDREAEMIHFIIRLLQATRGPLPDSPTLAVDATAIPTFARGHKHIKAAEDDDYQRDTSTFVRTDNRSWDKDASWGHRTPTQQSNDSPRVFGYQMLTATTTFPQEGQYQRLKLFMGITLVPANAQQPAPMLRMLDEIAQHQALETVIVDKGFSQSATRKWAEPLRERQLAQVFDVKETQRGAYLDPDSGALIIDGWPYAPWTPEKLHRIAPPRHWVVNEPGPKATTKQLREYKRDHADLERFRKEDAERALYAFVPNGKARPNGSRQFFTASHGKQNATAHQRTTKAFRQPTVVIGANVRPQLRQHHRWGSPEWIAAYNRRGGVEASHGNLKSNSGESFQRGQIRLIGMVRTSLMAAFAAVHHNLRMLNKWAQETGQTALDPDLLSPDPIVFGYEPVTNPPDDSPPGLVPAK